jgi:hypothetical protein
LKILDKIFILTSLLFIFSCSILKPVTENNKMVALNEINLSVLNGTYYENTSVSLKSNFSSLYWSFFLKGKVHYNDHYNGEEFIRLQVINPNKIKVSLIREDSTIDSRVLKGGIKNNSFEFKRRWVFYPILFTNLYKDSKVRVSILQNGNLSVDSKTMAY